MKKNYVKIMFLSTALLAVGATSVYAGTPKDEKEKEEVKADADVSCPVLTISGTNESASFIINSESLMSKEISIKAPNGFTVTPATIPANSKKQKVTVTLNSTKKLTEGKIILKGENVRSCINVKGYGTALPVKDVAGSPVYQGKNEESFSQAFTPGKDGYTIEFKVKTDEAGKEFYPYFVDGKGLGVKGYVQPTEVGVYNSYKKAFHNPESYGRAGGSGKFYNNDGQAHTYRFAVTPDNRAFIFRDGISIDTIRTVDYAPQPYFSDGMGELVENLLKNSGFEGEFEVNPETKLVDRIEGWDVVISDRWNSEQQILPEELSKELDADNHIFQIKPYKWGSGWSDGILAQVVDVAPNETYTLSAMVKGGISKKKGKNTGKIIIEEVQDNSKKSITEITSPSWETYSMDYTTSADCKQIRISFTVGRGGWGNDIAPICVDNTKLTGVSRTYSPKFGFEKNTAELEYFTIDESGAYAPAQPTIQVDLGK